MPPLLEMTRPLSVENSGVNVPPPAWENADRSAAVVSTSPLVFALPRLENDADWLGVRL